MWNFAATGRERFFDALDESLGAIGHEGEGARLLIAVAGGGQNGSARRDRPRESTVTSTSVNPSAERQSRADSERLCLGCGRWSGVEKRRLKAVPESTATEIPSLACRHTVCRILVSIEYDIHSVDRHIEAGFSAWPVLDSLGVAALP